MDVWVEVWVRVTMKFLRCGFEHLGVRVGVMQTTPRLLTGVLQTDLSMDIVNCVNCVNYCHNLRDDTCVEQISVYTSLY